MKFLALLLPVMLFAESYLVSNLPLPKTYIQNLDINTCDSECLEQYLKYGEIFSFLAHAQTPLKDPILNEIRMIHISLFNLSTPANSDELKIAMLLPHRQIGRYAQSTTNALFAYMLAQNVNYEFKSFYIEDESEASIEKAIETISDEGYHYLIAPLTIEGAEHLAELPNELQIYVPTVNRNDINETASDIFFGGIDYQAQIEALMRYVKDPLVIFYDESRLGRDLKDRTRDAYALLETDSPIARKIYSYGISKKSSNLKYPLRANPLLENASFMLNTPVVKSGMIMSQITLFDVNASNILSTQINYDPLLFTLTQYHDRDTMLIANSINLHNNVITEANALLNNDIQFDWINYATTIGSDYFYSLATSHEREYNLPISNEQIQYPISIVRPQHSKFVIVDDPF
jgi:hypothetical protein